MSENLERIVMASPAFDRRHPDPKQNYGIGGVRLTFIVKGKHGAIQFMIGTDWYPPHVQEERHHQIARSEYLAIQPSGWDVGYHSHVPMYDGQSPMANECHILGGQCFYDGSSLLADEWRDKFLSGGTDWLWPALEREYGERFHDQIMAAKP